MEQTIERDYQYYQKKGFTISLEQLPGVEVSLLHITKGKTTVSLPLSDNETELMVQGFKFTVQPPIFETF